MPRWAVGEIVAELHELVPMLRCLPDVQRAAGVMEGILRPLAAVSSSSGSCERGRADVGTGLRSWRRCAPWHRAKGVDRSGTKGADRWVAKDEDCLVAKGADRIGCVAERLGVGRSLGFEGLAARLAEENGAAAELAGAAGAILASVQCRLVRAAALLRFLVEG